MSGGSSVGHQTRARSFDALARDLGQRVPARAHSQQTAPSRTERSGGQGRLPSSRPRSDIGSRLPVTKSITGCAQCRSPPSQVHGFMAWIAADGAVGRRRVAASISFAPRPRAEPRLGRHLERPSLYQRSIEDARLDAFILPVESTIGCDRDAWPFAARTHKECLTSVRACQDRQPR